MTPRWGLGRVVPGLVLFRAFGPGDVLEEVFEWGRLNVRFRVGAAGEHGPDPPIAVFVDVPLEAARTGTVFARTEPGVAGARWGNGTRAFFL